MHRGLTPDSTTSTARVRAELDATACRSVLRSLGEIAAKFTAAHASVLARFDAADAHDSDGSAPPPGG